MPEGFIETRNVHRSFERGRVAALRGVDLDIAEGEFVAVMGPSGCGKSTLLHLLGAIDRPSAGTIRVAGQSLADLRDLPAFRARTVGLVFQMFHLLPTLTALENVQVPMLEMPWSAAERRRRAATLLEAVGLDARASHRPPSLSGGERQRVAIARSLANGPRVLLADEPTGNLDSEHARQIVVLLETIHRERGVTLVLVTHDASVAAHAARTVRMLDGRVTDDASSPTTA